MLKNSFWSKLAYPVVAIFLILFFPRRVHKIDFQEFEWPYTRWLGDEEKWTLVIFTQCTFSVNHRFQMHDKCIIILKGCIYIDCKAPTHNRIFSIVNKYGSLY